MPCTGKVQKVKDSDLDSLLPLMCSVMGSTFLTALCWRAAFQLVKKAGCLWVNLELHVRISVPGIQEDQGNKPNIS